MEVNDLTAASGMTLGILASSRVRESRAFGSARAKAGWPGYATTIETRQGHASTRSPGDSNERSYLVTPPPPTLCALAPTVR